MKHLVLEKLGEKLTNEKLNDVLRIEQESGQTIDRILLKKSYLPEDQVLEIFAEALGYPFRPDLEGVQVPELFSERVPIEFSPIIVGGECIGSVRESSLMARVIEAPEVLERAVTAVMESPYPVVHDHDPMDHVLRLFTRENEAVLVRSAGKIDGILTRFDMIQHLSGR